MSAHFAEYQQRVSSVGGWYVRAGISSYNPKLFVALLVLLVT